MASHTILDELVIEAQRNSRGGCTVFALMPVGRQIFLADVDVMGPKRALIEAQKNPLVIRELVKLTAEAKKIRARNEAIERFADDEEIALYRGEQDDDLLRAAEELGIDLSEVAYVGTNESHDDELNVDFPVVIESDPYVTA